MSAPGADGAQIDGAQIDGAQIDGGGSEPESPPQWLGPIQSRMEELHEQSTQMADRIAALTEADYDDDDGYALSDEDYARFEAEHGDEIDALLAEDDDEPDLLDVVYEGVDRAVSKREAAAQAEEGVEQRNEEFEDLRARMPLLQNPQVCQQIVAAAQAKAQRWDPDLINRPEFVSLIETELLAHIGQRARAQQAAGASQPEIVLESASGSVPQQARDDSSQIGDRIVAAAQRLRPQI